MKIFLIEIFVYSQPNFEGASHPDPHGLYTNPIDISGAG